MVGNADKRHYIRRATSWIENMQLEPDIQVKNTPNSLLQGKDLQLEAAIKSLLKEI